MPQERHSEQTTPFQSDGRSTRESRHKGELGELGSLEMTSAELLIGLAKIDSQSHRNIGGIPPLLHWLYLTDLLQAHFASFLSKMLAA